MIWFIVGIFIGFCIGWIVGFWGAYYRAFRDHWDVRCH